MAKGLLGFLEKLFGKKKRDYAKIKPILSQVIQARDPLKDLSDEQLRAKRDEFAKRMKQGETTDDLLPEAFGVVWEACRRLTERKASWPVWDQEMVWDMIPYDVQIIGAIVLHQGRIAEMATGEGKTLVAMMPLYLNSISGKGAHLVTVNDYLARRDAEWMGGVLSFLGCNVRYLRNNMTPDERREVYAADIAYGTNNEFGFDYLRDNMGLHVEHLVQRGFNYAIVDEVDSVLIDEARTPLIISGAVDKSTHRFEELNPRVAKIVRNQMKIVNDWLSQAERTLRGADTGEEITIDDETALMLLRVSRGAPRNSRYRKLAHIPGVLETVKRTEEAYMSDKAMWEADEDLLYIVEEKNHHVDMTEKGREVFAREEKDFFVLPDLAEEAGSIQDDQDLTPEEKAKKLAAIEQAYALKNEQISNVDQLLRAYALYTKDDEYIIQDGKIIIVDEHTGRVMPGRRFSEGLHQALEAKEGVKVEKETQTLATVTIQNFFRMYDKLAGMTGTAETEEAEFNRIYDLDVVVIPTNRAIARAEYDDVIYKTKKAKYKAIVAEVERLHKLGLPVLVGTVTVEVSELLSRLLRLSGVNHNVLNAKQHKNEAEIVAGAGRFGAVTIATNMAGRGTDIKLAPEVMKLEETWPQKPELAPEDYEEQPVGLQIIGTERHESRRIDRQLRGRSGRQGDPGSAVFFLSLEDDLMRLFSPDRIIKVMDQLGVEEDEVITHKMVTRAIEKAQIRVEQRNFEVRKHLIEYDDVVNRQREVIYGLRREILEDDDISDLFEDYYSEAVKNMVAEHANENDAPDFWQMDKLAVDFQRLALTPLPLSEKEHLDIGVGTLEERLIDTVKERYETKVQRLTPKFARQLERYVLMQVIDEYWRDHLNQLILLRSGIGLRSYAQRDPLVEYKAESFNMFQELMGNIQQRSVNLFFRAELAPAAQEPAPEPKVERLQAQHQETSAYEQGPMDKQAAEPQPGRMAPDKQKPVQREEPKVGRNDPCPCGSGKKYKKCCGQ